MGNTHLREKISHFLIHKFTASIRVDGFDVVACFSLNVSCKIDEFVEGVTFSLENPYFCIARVVVDQSKSVACARGGCRQWTA